MGQATVVALVVLAIVAIVLAHPIAKFDEFKNPTAGAILHGTTTTDHLLNSSGSGRWQFWSAAISEFRAHPLNGGGAGSWEAWWLQHGSLPVKSEFAHSLYLEALAELGIIGLLLIVAAVVVAGVGAVRSALALQSGEIAAAAACGIAFFVAAAYDWVWQLAGVAVVGVGMLGFALGALPASRASAWGRFRRAPAGSRARGRGGDHPPVRRPASGGHLSNSHAAYRAGDGARARSEALAAKAIEPWAASPYLQLGFVAEAEHHYGEAVHWADEAIRRSRDDWNLWASAGGFRDRERERRSRQARPRRGAPSQPAFGPSRGAEARGRMSSGWRDGEATVSRTACTDLLPSRRRPRIE